MLRNFVPSFGLVHQSIIKHPVMDWQPVHCVQLLNTHYVYTSHSFLNMKYDLLSNVIFLCPSALFTRSKSINIDLYKLKPTQ